MWPFLSLLILAFAVSLDGFGVGVMYGLRKIRVPLHGLFIISLCSGIIINLSMQAGQWMLRFLSPTGARSIGAVILLGIGIWAIYQIITRKDEPDELGGPSAATEPSQAVQLPANSNALTPEPKKMLRIEIKRLGLVIQILKTPSVADWDHSGNISMSEATLLGIALSLDAFGAGIGAALIGFAPLATAATIAAASGSFIGAGLAVGYRFANLSWIRKLSILPGCILILMGILKLL
ncbi:MAG: putative rane protein [Paenibacillaceae bacterium]|nr:putative rane protein [Paenibacillaceae bacterium]